MKKQNLRQTWLALIMFEQKHITAPKYLDLNGLNSKKHLHTHRMALIKLNGWVAWIGHIQIEVKLWNDNHKKVITLSKPLQPLRFDSSPSLQNDAWKTRLLVSLWDGKIQGLSLTSCFFVTKSLSRCFCFSSLLLALRSCTKEIIARFGQLGWRKNKAERIHSKHHDSLAASLSSTVKKCPLIWTSHIWMRLFIPTTPPVENAVKNRSSLRSFCRRSSSIRSLSAAVDTSQQRPGWGRWLGEIIPNWDERVYGFWILGSGILISFIISHIFWEVRWGLPIDEAYLSMKEFYPTTMFWSFLKITNIRSYIIINELFFTIFHIGCLHLHTTIGSMTIAPQGVLAPVAQGKKQALRIIPC